MHIMLWKVMKRCAMTLGLDPIARTGEPMDLSQPGRFLFGAANVPMCLRRNRTWKWYGMPSVRRIAACHSWEWYGMPIAFAESRHGYYGWDISSFHSVLVHAWSLLHLIKSARMKHSL